MKGFFTMASVALAALITGAAAAPTTSGVTIVQPGGIADLIITDKNTLNGTSDHIVNPVGKGGKVSTQAAYSTLQVKLVNNFGGGQLKAYITGKDTSGNVVMVSPNGQFFYPNPNGATTPVEVTGNFAIPMNPQGQTTTFTIPNFIQSSRIYIAAGNLKFYTMVSGGRIALVEPAFVNPKDPSAGVKYGFVEFNFMDGSIYANLSFVDFVGMVLGMSLNLADGSFQNVQGLKNGAVQGVCNDMRAQSSRDGKAEWGRMCLADGSGNVLRTLSPNMYLSIPENANELANYYTDYVNQVWNKYSSQDLVMNVQGTQRACRVSGNVLNCAGDNRSYQKPTHKDIFGCNSGPFLIVDSDNSVHRAIVPVLCAAFHRSVLLLNGGNVQPSGSNYYSVNPTSHYSRIVHSYESDGKGYSFAYDDVNPTGANEAGVVAGYGPTLLTISVGT